MSDEIEFIDGLIVKPPHENAPDFVIAKVSIKREELIEWLEARDGEWINADIREAKSGKYYAAVDNWKPSKDGGGERTQRQDPAPRRQQPATQPPPADDFADDDIPF
jgi:hypothetical protein